MTSRSRFSLAFGAVLALALAPAGLPGQELSAVSGTTSHLLEPVTVDALSMRGIGPYDAGSRFCGSPFDVRYGRYWSVYLGGPFGYRPFGYGPVGWYGRYAGWNGPRAAFLDGPCAGGYGLPLFGGYYGMYGPYGAPGWSFWSIDPWIWGYGYNPRLAYGYGYSPKSGWWAPFGYGSAPYGSDREVFEDMARRGSAPRTSPTQTAGANPVGAGKDGPDVTRFGSTGIRARGADLRRVRPDIPPMVVLGGDPDAGATGRADGTAMARTANRPLSRETLGDALARSRAELAARRVELMRESAPGDLARRGLSPVRGAEVFVRPIETPRSAGFDRGRFGTPRYEGAIPRVDSSFERRAPAAPMGRSAPPRSFSSPPRPSPAPAPARSGGSGGRSRGGKTVAPE
jgi:hypothetical protein